MATTTFRSPPPPLCRAPSRPLHSQSSNRVLSSSFFSSSASRPLPLIRHSPPPLHSAVAFLRRRKNAEPQEKDDDEDIYEYNPLEVLFSQIEEDLKNDKGLADDGIDDEISEEDVMRLEKELGEILSDYEEEVERIPELKTWQLQKLAAALNIGRRKIGIKMLADELGLDRAVVLELLRRPPPKLLMMSASQSDEIVESPIIMESKQVEPTSDDDAQEEKPKPKKLPVHEMREIWSKQKRLKKWQVGTLEKVYRRMRRPSDSMVSSIIYATNLPRKTIIKWFDNRRAQDGVPERKAPYNRSTTKLSSG